ncbi:MAG: 16S rRNA (cytidine(1402)-2'-O)-methyltransferase [Candidatus Marinimicrobia bacterium]|nr:16S rRNA (cytidine(1402)-2'-O)-methyltransferase [Candidatus Neomarinimicrobiota bacterium]
MNSGVLFVVSTPIGNLEDITLRAIQILKKSKIIAAEDTRQSKKLLNHFNITTPLMSYFDHNKSHKIPIIINRLKNNEDISIISDAGTPAISDPAYKLVRAAIKEDIVVESIPGPSSFICALTTSGLPTDRFIFEGFLPPKKGRLAILKDLSLFYGTVIFFENPKRLHRTLQDILNTFGERPCVIARELTKMHEEIIRGTVSSILNDIDTITQKGEMVILVGKDNKNVYF